MKPNVNLEAPCEHVSEVKLRHVSRPPAGCEACLRDGTQWVHLRVCLTCGVVGCCDSSPMRHATAHFHHTGHPIIASGEVGEDWAWCFPHARVLSA